MLEHQLTVFRHLDRGKCAVVPNGWEPLDSAPDDARTTAQEPAKSITLLFAGALSEHTLPHSLLNDVAAVLAQEPALEQRLGIVFAGQKSPAAVNQLKNFRFPAVLELRDQVSKSVAADMMQQASALLLINEKRLTRYVPGKLYDYIASGKRILLYGVGGESARIVSDLAAGQVVAEGDVSALRAFILGLSESPQHAPRSARVMTWLDQHTRQATSRAFLGLMTEGV